MIKWLFHYSVYSEFYKKLYHNSFTQENIDSKSVQHSEKFFSIKNGVLIETFISKPEDRFYVKATKQGHNYLIPERFIKEMPFVVEQNDIQKVRLKRNDTNVYHFVTDVTSLKIPKKKTSSFKVFIDKFNPVEVSNPQAFTLLKMIAMSPDVKMGVCSNVMAGKNANLSIVKNIMGNVARLENPPTKAVFWQTLKFNRTLVVDELTSWKPDASSIEDTVAIMTDESTDAQKSSLDKNNQIDTEELLDKGIVFTFNPVDDKHKVRIHEQFANGTKFISRVPLIYITNEVKSGVERPNQAQRKQIMLANMESLKEIAMNVSYFTSEKINDELHGYDRSLSPFNHNTRWKANMSPLLDRIDAYCESQEEFDGWMGYLRSANRLVAQHFIPNPYDKTEVNHKDGNKTNNHVDNLEWCTKSENNKHAYEMGVMIPPVHRGEDRHQAKLKEKDIVPIFEMYERGMSMEDIGNKFGVTRMAISSVLCRNSWKHVEIPEIFINRKRRRNNSEENYVNKMEKAGVLD
jgi:hypothetical protein